MCVEGENSVLHGPVYIQVILLYSRLLYWYQRWSEYNTNLLEYEYEYFEHAWVRVQVRVL